MSWDLVIFQPAESTKPDDSAAPVIQEPKASDQQQRKKELRRLLVKYHPDKNPGDPVAEANYRKAHAEYQALTSSQAAARKQLRAAEPSSLAELSGWLEEDRAKDPYNYNLCKVAECKDEQIFSNILALIEAGRFSYANFEDNKELPDAVWDVIFSSSDLTQQLVSGVANPEEAGAPFNVLKFAQNNKVIEPRKQEPSSVEELEAWLRADILKAPANRSFLWLRKQLIISQQLLPNILKLIKAQRLSYADFEKDEIFDLAWTTVFADNKIAESLVKGELSVVEYLEKFENYSKKAEFRKPEDDKDNAASAESGSAAAKSDFQKTQRRKQKVTVPIGQSYGNCFAGMDAAWEQERQKQESKPAERTLSAEDRFYLLEMNNHSGFPFLSDNTTVANADLLDSNKSWGPSVLARDIVWVAMLQEFYAYRDQSEGCLSREGLLWYLKKIHDFMYLTASDYEQENFATRYIRTLIAPIMSARKKLGDQPDAVIKAGQLDELLARLRNIFREGVKDLVKAYKGGTKVGVKQHEIIHKAIAEVKSYETKKEIRGSRNLIKDILRGVLGVIVGLVTCLGIALSKDYRRRYNASFWYSNSKNMLQKGRRDLLKAAGPAPSA